MNVEEMTFGVEIETSIPHGTVSRVGGHGRGLQVEWLPRGWKADADPSIRPEAGHQAVEFVSPVLKGRAGMKQLMEAVRTIIAKGGKVNASCGLHVHVGFNKTNEAMLRQLVTMVANYEKAIYAQTGTKAREQGTWCRGMQGYGSLDRAMEGRQRSRYHVVNTLTDKPTVEFRAFAATLNAEKVAGHVLTCVALVQKTLMSERRGQFTPKPVKPTSPVARKGDGQTALCRLFYALGWIRGREDMTYGNLFGDPTTSSDYPVPTLKEVKKELMRLAKKYDSRADG